MPDFLEFYTFAFAVFLPTVAVAIVLIGLGRAGVSGRIAGVVVALVAAFFGIWFAVTVPLARADIFNVPATLSEPPIVLAFLCFGAAMIWAAAWLTPMGRRISMATPDSVIAAFQIPRVMGGVFLIGWLYGSIPSAFAIPAGLGDIWAGVAGYQASVALARGVPNAKRLLWRANVIGIADFALAIVLGVVTSEGFAHLLSKGTPNIINNFPLALFPAFFVPIFLGFHLISLSKLMTTKKSDLG